MPDDNRTQGQSNDAPRDPLDDLIAPILGHDRPADSNHQPVSSAAQNESRCDPLDDLLPETEPSRSVVVGSKSLDDKMGKFRRDFNNFQFPDAANLSGADRSSHSVKSVLHWPFDQSGRAVAVNQSSKLPLGGWLAFVAVGLVIGSVVGAIRLCLEISVAMDGKLAIEYPGFNDLLIAEVLIWGALLVFQVVLAVLFFKKHRAVPKLMVCWLFMNLLGAIVFLSWSEQVFRESIDPVKFLASPVVLALIWIPYFASSKRVKRTFGDARLRPTPAKEMHPERDDNSQTGPKTDVKSVAEEIVLFTEDELRAVAQKAATPDECRQISLDDRAADTELIAESKPLRLRSDGVKQTEQSRVRFGILVGTLVVLTVILLARQPASREGLNQPLPSAANERRIASAAASSDQSAQVDEPLAIAFDFRRYLKNDDSKPTDSSAPETPRREALPQSQTDATTPPKSPEELFARVNSSVVRINVRDSKSELFGTGSGFFVRDDSTIVTNFHVVEGAHSAEVVLHDGTEFFVSGVESFDETSDVAILRVVHNKTKLIRPLGFSLELPAVASKAYVIGAPAGLDNSFSEGSVSGHREIDGRAWIQTTAPISPGSSGSPMFNERGLVIGMATKSRVVGQNLNFAVASRHIQEMLPNGARNVVLKLTNLPNRRQPPKPAVVEPIKPKDDDDGLKEAQKHIAAGLMRRALQTLDDIPEENRGPRYWRVRATAFFSIAKYQDSAKCYSESLKLDNTHSDTWIHYATTLHIDRENNEKNDDTILAACRAALKIDRNDARAYHMMGMTFLGREERIDAFKTALSLDEANLGTHYHLGCELAGVSRKNGEASKHFKRALALIGTADRFQVIPNPSRSSRRLGYITGNKIDDYSDRGSFETFLRLQLAAVCEGEERFALCREVLKSEPKNHVAKELMGLIKYNPDIVAFPDLRAGSLSAGITGILVFPK